MLFVLVFVNRNNTALAKVIIWVVIVQCLLAGINTDELFVIGIHELFDLLNIYTKLRSCMNYTRIGTDLVLLNTVKMASLIC